MRYVSLDIETTGLDPKTCQIVELGMVIDDLTDPQPISMLPTFHCYVKHPQYSGHPKALSMHSQIFQRIADEDLSYTYYTSAEMAERAACWLRHNGIDLSQGINPAGKNFSSFDKQFLQASPHWRIRFKHRALDPAILYYEPGDECLPDLQTCLDRAGIVKRVAHNAVDDAVLVVELLRKKLCK